MNTKRKGLLILLAFLILGIIGCADESSSDNTDLIIDDGSSGNSDDNTDSNNEDDSVNEYQKWYLDVVNTYYNYLLGNSDLDDTATTTWKESIANVLPEDYPAFDYPILVSSISNIIHTDITAYTLYVDYYSVIINGLTEEEIDNILNDLQEYYISYSDDMHYLEDIYESKVGVSIDGLLSIPVITTGEELSGAELNQKDFKATHNYTTENGVEPYYLQATSHYNPSNSRGSIMLIYMVNYNYVYH